MILDIFLLTLLIIFISLSLFFLFFVLIPVLESQQMIDSQLIYGDLELEGYSKFAYDLKKGEKQAFVTCNPDRNFERLKILYDGERSCRLFFNNYGSEMFCSSGCIGLGDCVAVCPVNAIAITNDTAVVTDACVGCGICINICPKNLIKMIDADTTDNCKKCNVENSSFNSCTMKNELIKKSSNESKLFKFWNFCYNIIYKNK